LFAYRRAAAALAEAKYLVSNEPSSQ
jgi:hypothetical protein